MRVIIKIVLTIVLLIVGTIIIGAIKAGMGTKASTGGIGPFIIYPAMTAGIYAIWKWNPDKKKDTSADNEILKKD
jgi:uncharacterized BrkB/YihY/UPF0761 family membrane protein